MGGGYFYRTLNKDIKEINKVFLSLFSVGIILIAIFVGINITNNSYALFSDNVISTNTIGVEVDTCNLYVPNKPILDTNMIPVYYDEINEVWKKADSTNQDRNYKWYDYCEKKWANSVTVTSSSRSTYLNAALGTEIDMEDILTMQVWVPRYKYKVWNYNADGTVTSEPQEIEIVFEEGKASTGDIVCTDNIQGEGGDGTSEICKLKSTNAECTDNTCNNKYYTHPAFTFGEEELTGFWIGKFEVSSDIECEITTSYTVGEGCNLTTIKPLTKPNTTSWRGAQIGTFDNNIRKMNDEDNIYGFSTSVDTHMIKNMEWGAVAYLSNSKYGTCINETCTEIGINNNSNYITGCGAEAGSSSSSTCNSYNTELGQGVSTTGNIYGIYDMSGGAWDFVMSNIVSLDGKQMLSGESHINNSGYTGITYNNGTEYSYLGYYTYPEEKYYDKYSFISSDINYKITKLGDATKEFYVSEAYYWYNDLAHVAYYEMPWFRRGGWYNHHERAGIFSSYHVSGIGGIYYSTHFIIS